MHPELRAWFGRHNDTEQARQYLNAYAKGRVPQPQNDRYILMLCTDACKLSVSNARSEALMKGCPHVTLLLRQRNMHVKPAGC